MVDFAKFFKQKTLVASIFEIPVRIDNLLWVAIFLLAVVSAFTIPNSVLEDPGLRFLIGLLTTLLFFASILLHELGHLLVASRERLEVREIILQPFGGLSRLKRPPENAESEFRIAVAGPVTSFLLTLIFWGAYLISNWSESPIFAQVFYFLGVLNALVAIVNIFPGFPLDGGRILRALFWKQGKEIHEATVVSGRAGQTIGIALLVLGLVIAAFFNNFFMGLWLAAMGIFLALSATKSIGETNKLEAAKVRDVMSRPLTVLPTETILHFVDNILPSRRQTAFIVAQGRQFLGILALEDVKAVDKTRWKRTKIKSVMRPLKPEYFVDETTPFEEAKEIMRQNGVGIVAVLDGDEQLVGYLQRGRYRRKLK